MTFIKAQTNGLQTVQVGQTWRLKVHPTATVMVLGVTTWYDTPFVWMGMQSGGTDAMSLSFFRINYELEHSPTPIAVV